MALPKHLYKRALKKRIDKEVQEVSSRDIASVHYQGPLHKLPLFPFDQQYRIIGEALLKDILERNSTDDIQYESEIWDCDDYARALSSEITGRWRINSVGTVIDFSGGHAYCVAYINGPSGIEQRIIEPQTDGFVKIGEGISAKEIYAADRGFVIL